MTFGSASSGSNAVILTYASGAVSNVVVLLEFFDGANDYQRQSITLVHELLHYPSGLGNVAFARQYAHYTGDDDIEASVAI